MSNQTMAICRAMLVFVCLVSGTSAQSGGGYDLTWSTNDAGGGGSAGGGFESTGTIGQPDASAAGTMNGGGYSLTGGFWGATLPGCPSFVVPDFDQDCDVDEVDVNAFLTCATRSDVPLTPGCEGMDLDDDDDVDMNDFGRIQRCYGGAGNLPDPNCY